MDNEERLLEYLDLCRRIYQRMLKDGTWPWADSPKFKDLVESGDSPTGL